MCVDVVRNCQSLVLPDLLNARFYETGAFRKDKVLADIFSTHTVVYVKLISVRNLPAPGQDLSDIT
jgi:hypothetical protein